MEVDRAGWRLMELVEVDGAGWSLMELGKSGCTV